MGVQPPNLNALRKFILSNGPYAWWAADPDLCTDGAGLTQVGSDLVANRAMTFGVGHRPTHDVSNPLQPCWVFAGAEGGKDAGGLLNGLGAVSVFLVVKPSTYTDYRIIVCYQTDTGAAVMAGRMTHTLYLTTGLLGSEYDGPGGVIFNQMQTDAALSAAYHVVCSRMKYSDGTTSAKTTRVDGADVACTRFTGGGGDSTGGSLGNYPLIVGCADTAFGALAYPMVGNVCDILIAPYYDDGTADIVQRALQSLRSTP